LLKKKNEVDVGAIERGRIGVAAEGDRLLHEGEKLAVGVYGLAALHDLMHEFVGPGSRHRFQEPGVRNCCTLHIKFVAQFAGRLPRFLGEATLRHKPIQGALSLGLGYAQTFGEAQSADAPAVEMSEDGAQVARQDARDQTVCLESQFFLL
jgi:hypothetical protein